MSIGRIAMAALLAAAAYGQQFQLGGKVAPFAVQDLTGVSVQSESLSGKVTVVTFMSTQCPVSNGYNDRMSALYRDYSAKGVKFIFVNANRTEPAAEVAGHAKSIGFPFPVYKDLGNKLADLFGAEVTPQSYVIDSSGTLVYRGQIDDSQNEARIQRRMLRMVLDAVLEGRPVPVAETKAFGCTIKRVRRMS